MAGDVQRAGGALGQAAGLIPLRDVPTWAAIEGPLAWGPSLRQPNKRESSLIGRASGRKGKDSASCPLDYISVPGPRKRVCVSWAFVLWKDALMVL